MKKRDRVAGVMALAILMGSIAMSGFPLTNEAIAADPVTLTVSNPGGASEVTKLFSPRLANLHGKTICELTNDSWEDKRTFPLIRELLQKMYPTAKFFPFTKFPKYIGKREMVAKDVGKALKTAGCDAVIVGNAG
jgi:hypothetical protein